MQWDLLPEAFSVSVAGLEWPIYWYGLFIFRYMYRPERKPPDDVYDLVLTVIAGTLIGARIGEERGSRVYTGDKYGADHGV